MGRKSDKAEGAGLFWGIYRAILDRRMERFFWIEIGGWF